METNLQTNKLGTFPGAALTIAETGIDLARGPMRRLPSSGRPNETTEQLKVVNGLVKTLLTFVTEMIKIFEKMKSGGERSPAPGNPLSVTPSPVNPTPPTTPQPTGLTPTDPVTEGKKIEDPLLDGLATQMKSVLDQMTSMQKRIERISKKISGLGRKLLKGLKG